MLSQTTSLNDHKNKKIYKKIIKDIESILQVLTLTQKGLTLFKSYITVQEIISVVNTNITLLDLKRKDYEKKLKAITEQ